MRIYTDRDCTLYAATVVPMPEALASRIAHEETRSLAAAIEQGTAVGVDFPAGQHPSRRPVASGCARTPMQLALDLQGSFALGNVNRVAESYHWVGLDNARAQRLMDRLEHLGRKPLIGSRYYPVQAFANADDVGIGPENAGAFDSTGMMQLVFGDAISSSITDLQVVRYAGCYFVKFGTPSYPLFASAEDTHDR